MERTLQGHYWSLMGNLLRTFWWTRFYVITLSPICKRVFPKEAGNLTAVSAPKCVRRRPTRAETIIGLLSSLNSFMDSKILRGRPFLCCTQSWLWVSSKWWGSGSEKENYGEVFRWCFWTQQGYQNTVIPRHIVFSKRRQWILRRKSWRHLRASSPERDVPISCPSVPLMLFWVASSPGSFELLDN